MVIVEPVQSVVESFFWFLPYEVVADIDGIKGEVEFDFPAERFVPLKRYVALDLFYSDEGAGLRALSGHMVLVKIENQTPQTYIEKTGREVPEDYSYSPELEYISESEEGYIIKPFKGTLRIVKTSDNFFEKTKEWSAVKTGILSPNDILEMANDPEWGPRRITEDVIYNEDGTVRTNGPADLRLGSYGKGSDELCGTCGNSANLKDSKKNCPGHFGYIHLEVPVPNYMFLGGNKSPLPMSPLMHIINSTCEHCHRILINDSKLKKLQAKTEAVKSVNLVNVGGFDMILQEKTKLFKMQHNIKSSDSIPKVLSCPHCEKPSSQYEFSYSGRGAFKFVPKDPDADPDAFLTYLQVVSWLEDIPKKDVRALGFAEGSEPEHMFLRYLPVQPNTNRPPDENPSSGKLIPNDLTELYRNVVEVNNRLREKTGVSKEFLTTSLFKSVSQTMTGQNASIGSGGMRTSFTKTGLQTHNLRGVWDRLKGVGRAKNVIRRQTQGKVSEHVAYSTITPDPGLQVDEIGIPLSACTELTVATEVTEENIEFLRECVRNGIQKNTMKGRKGYQIDFSRYPGASAITSEGREINLELNMQIPNNDGTMRDIMFKNQEKRKERAEFLKVGQIVHRNLIQGDWVAFTRAPALHRHNMLGFRAVPMNQTSLSLNPSVCIGFNADFDGDAMRVFVPQSKEAILELQEMSPGQHMLHSRYGRMFLTFDQDEISGSYLLSFRNKDKAGTPPGIETKESTDNDGKTYTWEVNNQGVGFDDGGQPLFSKSKAMNLLSAAFSRSEQGLTYMTKLPKPITYKGQECYRGIDIMSMFIPDGIHAEFKDKAGDNVRIEDGQIIEGVLDENAFGTKAGMLGAAYVYRFGWEEGNRQIMETTNILSRLVFAAHVEMGFTMGISDISFNERGVYKHLETGEIITKGQFETLLRENPFIGDSYIHHNPILDKILELHQEADIAIEDIERAFHEKRIDDIEGLDLKLFIRDPVLAKEDIVGEVAAEFEKKAKKIAEAHLKSDGGMSIGVNSGGRGSSANIQQMLGAYGMTRLVGTGKRIISGINHDRVFPHTKGGHVFMKPSEIPDEDWALMSEEEKIEKRVLVIHETDISGGARGFVPTAYAEGMDPKDYYFGSIAGIRSTIASSQGAIQESGYLEHKLKRALENLMVDENGHVVNLRTNQVVSFQTGNDGFRPYTARGPDNSDDGLRLSLQPILMDFRCEHNKTLYDSCSKCPNPETPPGDLFDKLAKISYSDVSLMTKAITAGRSIVTNDKKMLTRRLRAYIEDAKAPSGEMVGSNAAANFGEPATQAGLRAFHGGGKGSTPTVTRLRQYLELVKKEQQQPRTYLYLREQYEDKDNAAKIANFCTAIVLGDIVEKVEYDTNDMKLIISFNQKYSEELNIDFENFVEKSIKHSLKGKLLSIDKQALTAEVQCYNLRDLLLTKEELGTIPISGIRDVSVAVVSERKDRHGRDRVCIQLNGPVKGDDYSLKNPLGKMWSDLTAYLGKYIDFGLTDFTDTHLVFHIFGLEAAAQHMFDMIDKQMNGEPGSSGKIGDYDSRYTRTVVDYMCSLGTMIGLGKSGLMVKYNPSIIGAMGGEDPYYSLIPGAVMGNNDPLKGAVESIAAGKSLNIGSRYRRG